MSLIAEPYKNNDDLNDNIIGFNTYNYYLESIVKYMEDTYEYPDYFFWQVIDNANKLELLSTFDKHWVEKWLKLSWNTEFLLNQNSEDVDIIRLNNHWAPILCYFSIYSSLEAFVYLINKNKANGHEKALKMGCNYFMQSGLSPWNLSFNGAQGRKGNKHLPHNFPTKVKFPNCLSRVNVKPIEMIGTCLKAEHKKRIDYKYKNSSGVYKYKINPGHTNIFHFLYRLRLRSNYDSVDLYISSASDHDIKNFSYSLRQICFWSLLYMETLMIRKVGKNYLTSLANDYLKLNSKADDINYRLNLYNKI